jgi:hypothetical protein
MTKKGEFPKAQFVKELEQLTKDEMKLMLKVLKQQHKKQVAKKKKKKSSKK